MKFLCVCVCGWVFMDGKTARPIFTKFGTYVQLSCGHILIPPPK